MSYHVRTFDELTTAELFEIYQTRVAVFVVEQNCPYQEVDEIDPIAWHTYIGSSQDVQAYTRVYLSDGAVHMGRVLVKAAYRKQQLGKKVVQLTLDWIKANFPNQPIVIGAQAHLQDFYGAFGFETTSDVYLEDDIPHIDMEIPIL
ncbi:acetyltransferase [Enterococcus sp. JM4C]|uniref:GNAT family N-acetyltransferase n=1 Tax=Candidatus Enterococcus huntleyi TaxID=1857217 RepID=UPI00137B0D20|nr:GNAT family N-acetyltransferase [Enterococcus sp. JM4C]KAF1295147.1 acetyltransferase [Enterococcus sp. JM4C]